MLKDGVSEVVEPAPNVIVMTNINGITEKANTDPLHLRLSAVYVKAVLLAPTSNLSQK